MTCTNFWVGMMAFSFTATAQCDYCGQLLGSSDEECSHENQTVKKFVFRRIGEGRDSLVGVKATPRWKWYKLAGKIGEDWIAYEYLGTKSRYNSMITDPIFGSAEGVPKLGMSLDAPNDVNERISND